MKSVLTLSTDYNSVSRAAGKPIGSGVITLCADCAADRVEVGRVIVTTYYEQTECSDWLKKYGRVKPYHTPCTVCTNPVNVPICWTVNQMTEAEYNKITKAA